MFGQTPYHFTFTFYCVTSQGEPIIIPINANTLPQALNVWRRLQEELQSGGKENINFYHIEMECSPRASAN